MHKTSALVDQTMPPDAARRQADLRAIVRELRKYARAHGGRYIVHGSAVQDDIGYFGTLDLLVDFPEEMQAEAWRFAESLCDRRRIPHNIMPFSWGKPSFIERIRATMKSLG
jgi:hypothetical protein